MSKTQIVTYENVAATAQALSDDGKRPSVRAVMAAMGGGSPNSVLVHLNNWKAGRAVVAVAEVQVDPRIAQIVAEQISKATAEARSEIEQRLSETEADAAVIAEAGRLAELELDQVQQQVAALQSQVQQLSGTIEQLKADAETVKTDAAKQIANEQLRARDAVTKAEAESVRERSERESAQMELAKAGLRLESLPKLEAEIVRLQSALEAERTGRSSAEAGKAAAEAQANGLADRLTDAQAAAAAEVKAALARLSDTQAEAGKAASIAADRLAEQGRSCVELTAALKAEIQTLQQRLVESKPVEKPKAE